jgi:hypothetical protein
MAFGEACAMSINWPKHTCFQSLANASSASSRTQSEYYMMSPPTLGHTSEQLNSGSKTLSVDAMAFARKVAAEYQEMETGYRNALYGFLAKALTSYRKFLKEPGSYEELCAEDNISALREKPALECTSRLALYFHTGARNEAERNTAGKYARIVDYLHQERISSTAS